MPKQVASLCVESTSTTLTGSETEERKDEYTRIKKRPSLEALEKHRVWSQKKARVEEEKKQNLSTTLPSTTFYIFESS